MVATLDDPVVWQGYADALRPMPPMHPAEFAEKHRMMHEIYCSERPGKWDNTVFPYQPHVMNAGEEAIRTGKRGIVFMKGGQIGGTDAMITFQLWCKVYFPGPQLFMTSTDKVANEFGRERFELVIKDMEPLAKKYIPNRRGDIFTKRFIDGKIQICGGQSVFNLQSTPYRIVVIDELDSLVEDLGGQGDPVKLAEVRTDSFTGETLMIVYAHPSTRDRGAAKIFYEMSDQRRGFITHSCGHAFWLQWQHVKASPWPGQSQSDADKDASCYAYHCPGCNAVVSDAHRVAMLRGVSYRSTLPPAEAARKQWIGVHASQLYSPAKTIQSFAQRWIECGGDENAIRVFYNKILGEPYEPKVEETTVEALRSLIVVQRRPKDPEFYSRGQVPQWVRFLTAGQDSRVTEFHYAVWGWGLRRSVDNVVHLCGCLVDWGQMDRPRSMTFTASEYHVFDDLIYRRLYRSNVSDRQYQVKCCAHDIGYAPTQIPILTYCRNHPHRAIPAKGAALTHTSACNAPYAHWGNAITYKAGDATVKDESSRALLLNTFMIKTDMFGWMQPSRKIEILEVVGKEVIGARKVPRIVFPEDVDDEFLEQSKNEGLGEGDKKGELVWKKLGPNHYADCNTQSLGLAYNLDPFQQGMTAEEYQAKPRREYRDSGSGNGTSHDPSMG
jgi:phage terminase large subunit GpA-like protein